MNDQQLVPEELLLQSRKVLFIAHLAIGDFVYLQNCFQAFTKQYPHIAVDLWIDERRRTRFFWRWPSLRKYALYDWVRSVPYFNKIYDQTYSPQGLKTSIQQARAENYPLVILLTTFGVRSYARMARLIAPYAFIASVKQPKSGIFFDLFTKNNLIDKSIDSAFHASIKEHHISQQYALWFRKLVGLSIDKKEQAPFIMIPRSWISYAKLMFLKWGITLKDKNRPFVSLINIVAKHKKRCWPLERAIDLLQQINRQTLNRECMFIFNTLPEDYEYVEKAIRMADLSHRVIVFSAREHFFQLPAILSFCDQVISVETSVMHLAAALRIPVIALMRQKNPEWRPWNESCSMIIMTENQQGWIKSIPLEIVRDTIVDRIRMG